MKMDIIGLTKQLFAKKVDKQNYSEEEINGENMLIERIQIPNSPFEGIKHEKSGWFAVFGIQKISYEYKTKKELLQQFEGVNWDILMNAVVVITRTIKGTNETLEEAKQILNEN